MEVSAFSSRGPTYDGRIKPDFVALGEDVLIVDTTSSSAYKYARGTSYSSPSLCGAVALLLDVNPLWRYGDVYDALVSSAESCAADSLCGHGIPDAFDASGLEPAEPTASGFRVYDPYPQPITFSSSARRLYFPMNVPEEGRKLTIRIFTFSGDLVRTLESPVEGSGQLLDPGEAPSWDGMNYLGEDVAPGVYFYSIRLFGYGDKTGKIMVMR